MDPVTAMNFMFFFDMWDYFCLTPQKNPAKFKKNVYTDLLSVGDPITHGFIGT